MADFSPVSGLASRLRQLQVQNDWTVVEMAQLVGIPKRSLENYMRKEHAQVPSVEVIVKMSQGFGVALDWLLLGQENYVSDQGRLVRLCARAGSLPFLQSLSIMAQSEMTRPLAFQDGKLMGMSPEELATEIANEAGRRAEAVAAIPASSETLRISEIAVGLKPASKSLILGNQEPSARLKTEAQ